MGVTQKASLVECRLTIEGSRARIEGQYPVAKVRDVTSHYVPGFQFSDLYRRKKWDGKKHLFSRATKSMPAGLVPVVVAALKKYSRNARVEIIDMREQSRPATGNKGFDLAGIDFGKGVYDYQLDAAKACVEGKRGILKISTNGGKTEIACALARHLAVPTLFLVERLELLYQTRKRFSTRLQIPEESIGIVGDGHCRVENWITVATPASLAARLQNLQPERWQLVVADECHHAASDTFYNVLDAIPAYFRIGMSGTPLDRSDGADLRLVAQTGPVLFEVSNKLLVERGISVQPFVEMLKIDKPLIPPKLAWQAVNKLGVTENSQLNERIVEKTVEHVRNGEQVLILVDIVKHGTSLDKMLWVADATLRHQFINGKEEQKVRRRALDDFRAGRIRCLIATSILDEGVDVPNIDVLILAAGGKSKIRLLQRAGRGLRSGKGKKRLLIVDFANFTHKYLLKHSLQRLETYRAEECFVIHAGS